MDIRDITVNQLKRAARIKAQIERMAEELSGLFDGSAGRRRARRKRSGMSAAARKRIAAIQRARWAKLRNGETLTAAAKKPARKARKKTMSRAARAQRSAKMKAYWAAKKKANRKITGPGLS
jgi:hypothetical protein